MVSVNIDFDVVKSRTKTMIALGGADALMGYDSLMERSYDGFMVSCRLPCGSWAHSYREC